MAWQFLPPLLRQTGPSVPGDNSSTPADNSVTITLVTFCIAGLTVLIMVYGLALFCARRRRRERAVARRMRDGVFADALEAPQDVFTAFLQSKGLNRADLDRVCPEVVHRRHKQSPDRDIDSSFASHAMSSARLDSEKKRPTMSPLKSLKKHSSSALSELKLSASSSSRRDAGKSQTKISVGDIESDDTASSTSEEDRQRYVSSAKGEREEDDICVVCIEELADGDMKRVLPCPGRHHFHSRCIEVWLSKSARCPVCNQVLQITRSRERQRQMQPVSMRIENTNRELQLSTPNTGPVATSPAEGVLGRGVPSGGIGNNGVAAGNERRHTSLLAALSMIRRGADGNGVESTEHGASERRRGLRLVQSRTRRNRASGATVETGGESDTGNESREQSEHRQAAEANAACAAESSQVQATANDVSVSAIRADNAISVS